MKKITIILLLIVSPALLADEKYVLQFKNKLSRISTFTKPINGVVGEKQILSIVLEKNGAISNIKTKKPITNAMLKSSAVKIIHMASPYKSLSYDFPKETESIRIEVVFLLGDKKNILISKASIENASN